MSAHRPKPRRCVAWFTLWALVLATLAPGIARALAATQGPAAAWGQVCSASRIGAAAAKPAPAEGDVMPVLEHCPFCSLQADALGLPPAAAVATLRSSLGHALPRLYLQSPRPLFAWAPAQARAPPALV
nr:DUF2946 family protein [Aquabacterium terrae]